MKRKCLFCLWACLFSSGLSAQIIQPKDDCKHIAKINFGYDYNLISVDIGYAYYQPKYKTAAFIDLTQGTALLGTGNLRTQIGLQTWQGSFQQFNLKTSLAFVYARSTNKAGNYDGLGLNLRINAGLNLNRIGLGADLQYNPFFATHIKHSDFYLQYYYSESKDGWYKLTANTWRIGGYFSTLLGTEKTLELNLRGGYQTSGQYDKLIPGFYAIVGFNKNF